MFRSVTPPSGSHLRPGRDSQASSLLQVCRVGPRARPGGGGGTFEGTAVPQYPQGVLPPSGDIRLSGQTDDTDSPSRPRREWRERRWRRLSMFPAQGTAGAGNPRGHGSMGTVRERRTLPAGTGAKAHPGQMAAPETRWATGHQPSRPRTTPGEPGGRQSEVRSPAGRVWARLVDEWHRCGGSRTGCA